VELIGPLEGNGTFGADGTHAEADAHGAGADMDSLDRRLLHLLTEGLTNREMADQLDLDVEAVGERLARLLARLGASSRAEATSLAFRALAPAGAR
jgi:DNA-binding NarL/FixJ family response regulator